MYFILLFCKSSDFPFNVYYNTSKPAYTQAKDTRKYLYLHELTYPIIWKRLE